MSDTELTERLAQPGTIATQEFSVARATYGSGCGRFGSLVLDHPHRAGVRISGPNIEQMVDGILADGGRIRVTVEVIDPGELVENPSSPPGGHGSWAAYEDYCGRSSIIVTNRQGETFKGDRLRRIGHRQHATDGIVGLLVTVGYGANFVALADVERVEVRAGDRSTIEMLTTAGVAFTELPDPTGGES